MKLKHLSPDRLPIAIILPVILSVILFVTTIFVFIIPYMESTLMSYRRHLIHNLTEVAVSSLDYYNDMNVNGVMKRGEAQRKAIEHVRNLRYGTDSKDYFWINDMHPNMIMHPYRTDLDGTDVSHFADPKGKLLFSEMVKIVKQDGTGFVDYQWQWQDDPDQIEPKLSFVREFKPWNWIIGTGIYIKDIREEIDVFSKKLVFICTGLCLILFFLSFFIILQGVKVEKERHHAEVQSKIQQEQLFQAAKLASVGTLVSGVAHEINNPTTALMLNAPLLNKMWKDILPIIEHHQQENQQMQVAGMPLSLAKERIPKLLQHMEEGSRRIKEIVTDLKDFSHITPSELKDNVNLNLVTQKAINLISNIVNKHTDNLQVSFAPEMPEFKGNFQKIEQVIINLIMNACQALTDRSQELSIKTDYNKERNEVEVEVKDKGCGISEDNLTQIRDPFFTTKQNQGNTGLGLAISDKIIKDHQGTMVVHSQLNSGTCVRLKFPVNS
ncbi:MAG: cache domain-containing protein [Proteobacteria bacterium]|nr:cache domain-containing protein [Pseudomonadota bacterium]